MPNQLSVSIGLVQSSGSVPYALKKFPTL